MKWLLLLVFSYTLFSCQNRQQKALEQHANSSTQYVPKGVDSLDLLYFKKPFTDSLRYQRFFTYVRTGDTMLINALRENLQIGFQEFEAPANCLSEGKIIIPHGGDAFRIVYFSRMSSSCAYLYVIDNGRFRYYPIAGNVRQLLDQWEQKAVEP